MSMTTMTLTSLLDSLHSHLQVQTQLLPALHAQLGLPQTALEDELTTLQDQLIQGVELQIDLRRKQVEEWMEKCGAVETVCIRYTKALGGNVKATGTSLGELRKEQSLPRRYELVTEFQEKLRQAYHTKLEQLTTLTNRLNALTRTLGTVYFSQDTLDPTPAVDEAAFDTTAPRDVTPERFLKLEKELVRGKAEVTKRLNQLSMIFAQTDWLYTELGITAPLVEDLSQASSSGFASQRPMAADVSNDPFCVSTPTPASRAPLTIPLLFQNSDESDYLRTFARFIARIEEAEGEALPESPNVPLGLEGVEPTESLLEWATAQQISLEETKRLREAHIQAMYDQLEGLWRRLGVEEGAMDAFVEKNRGSTEETVREYEEELERMLELKRERMSQFVESAREEIMRLWDDLMVGEEERADFAPFADGKSFSSSSAQSKTHVASLDEFTEELLCIHEDEIRRLKEERRMKAPLLANIKKYFQICDEEKELLASASDQTRLLGRGRDPGRLLREEKMRKRVQKEKPRLEQDMLASIPAWEQETGKLFLVHGESILQLLTETVTQEQENKRKSGRAGSVPARSTTPVSSSSGGGGGYVPGRTGIVTPAVRPASSSSQSVPNKRQKLGDSTSSSSSSTATSHRVPLGSHGGNARVGSPTKNHAKTAGGVSSSIPRPGSSTRHAHIAMPVPRYGGVLGHGGRGAPSGIAFGSGRSTSGSAAVQGSGGEASAVKRFPSASHQAQGVHGHAARGAAMGLEMMMKRVSRTSRESFKPRPSIDRLELTKSMTASRWGGEGVSAALREEEEA